MMLALLRKLETRYVAKQQQLVSKSRTDTLDEIRYLAGALAELQDIIRLLSETIQKEGNHGRQD